MSPVVQKTLADLRDRGGLHSDDIAEILSVAPATVARWMRGEAAPDLGTRTSIGQLHYIVERLATTRSADEVSAWLHAALSGLTGATAIDLMRSGRIADVLAEVERLHPDGPARGGA
ncbi:helix-turn-helix domain-containing protein [Blastochloris tepida]|uniref:Uncharacterized protein n=1 Tax=Blastochloris tepida TaxID=2233851 RepID=A0A348FZ85_9HYPH|nr:helix-turn-helix transcriptional regulator [Blastochloris tepida]BBF92618.1 hypothetical protein BLTE_13030 [Blastochloris tepida]